MKKVLIADEETALLLSPIGGGEVPNNTFTTLTARHCKEAQEVLEAVSVDLLLIDLEKKRMDGFDLLAWVSQNNPQLPVIVLLATSTPQIQSRLAEYENVLYLETPLDSEKLNDAILTELKSKTKSFIKGITPATFLQLLAIEKKSCSLKITSDEGIGYLYLIDGNLVDAEYEDLSGENAAYQIVCWRESEIEMENLWERPHSSITTSLESILLNAHSRKDELGYRDEAKIEEEYEKIEQQYENLFSLDEKREVLPDEEVKTESKPILSEQARELIIQQTESSKGVAECILFDGHGFPERQNRGECSLHAFDPAMYVQLVDSLGSNGDFGDCRCVSFYTARRTPFILFRLADYSLLVKLQQGARCQVISKELNGIIRNIVTAG